MPATFLERFSDFAARHGLLEAGAPVLVGLSGGVDSVVLLHALHRLGYRPVAAHVNYGLRGAASQGDEHLARTLSEQLQVPFHAHRPDTRRYAADRGLSLQEAARDLRYRFFGGLAAQEGIGTVAVAHHLDDQAETVLLNLLRGAGLDGLAGMPPLRLLEDGGPARLVRPLLWARRTEIETFARTEGLPWRTDATNESLHYRRGALRTAILPLLEAHFGAEAPVRIARSASLVRAYLEEAGTPVLEAALAHGARALPGGGGRLALSVLHDLSPVWRRRLLLEALRRWLPEAPRSAAFAAELERLLEAQPGRRLLLPEAVVWRERDALLFLPSPPQAERAAPALVVPGVPAPVPGGTLLLEALAHRPAHLDAGPRTVFADLDRLALPLVARPWQSGDRFQPFGMRGTKKVSDFLTDARVPSHRRRTTLVLLSGHAILWVVGHRLAEPFRIGPATQRFAKITFIPHEEERPAGSPPTTPSVPSVP